MVSYEPSQTAAGNLYASLWCSPLAGVLRCASQKIMGLCSISKKTSGIFGSTEAYEKQIPEESANPPDSGQLLAAPQVESISVLQGKQHSLDLDADQCLMA